MLPVIRASMRTSRKTPFSEIVSYLWHINYLAHAEIICLVTQSWIARSPAVPSRYKTSPLVTNERFFSTLWLDEQLVKTCTFWKRLVNASGKAEQASFILLITRGVAADLCDLHRWSGTALRNTNRWLFHWQCDVGCQRWCRRSESFAEVSRFHKPLCQDVRAPHALAGHRLYNRCLIRLVAAQQLLLMSPPLRSIMGIKKEMKHSGSIRLSLLCGRLILASGWFEVFSPFFSTDTYSTL